MQTRKNRRFAALAALAGTLGVAATLTPMLPAWLNVEQEPDFRRGSGLRQSLPGSIVVDLRDNVSDADILDIERKTGLDLVFNSVHAHDEKLMEANIGFGQDAARTLQTLRADSRVEFAEQEQVFTVPEPGGWMANPLQTRRAIEMAVRTSNGQTFYVAPQGRDELGNTVYGWTSKTPDGTQIVEMTAEREITPDGMIVPPPMPTDRYECGYSASTFRPNDPRYPEQWNFRMIGAEGAWARSRGKGVVVAVIDTGVAAKTTKKGKQSRDFGETKFTEGYDFVNKDKDPFDDHGHGTHVAGTIAESTDNKEGVAGLAFEATIMPVKVLSSSGSGYSSDIADAIRFAADKGANVINMSLGSHMPSDVIHSAVKYARKKGVVIVCAAGNSFREGVGYPAAFPECIAVSSVGPTGELAKYSSWGKQVALAAPGGDMIDSGNPKDGILQNTNYPESQGGRGDDYYAFQGTSMASPHVAAAAALVMAQGVTDPARVRDVLTKTATPKNDEKKYGAGVLSAEGATARAAAETGPKLRHLLLYGLGFLALTVGGRRRHMPTRFLMALALGAGFFGPEWFTERVGADSAWNLLTFSAILPALALLLAGNGRGMKVAGMFALGTAVCLWANWHNNMIPFTQATFGESAVPWTAANMAAAFILANIAAWRAAKRGS